MAILMFRRLICATPAGAREQSEDSEQTLPPAYKLPTPPPRYEDIMTQVAAIERACGAQEGAGPSLAIITEDRREDEVVRQPRDDDVSVARQQGEQENQPREQQVSASSAVTV